ncbi:MAG: GNAT family N-acetyltransferase [Cyanobacteria bacterium P01_C01_bin.147]
MQKDSPLSFRVSPVPDLTALRMAGDRVVLRSVQASDAADIFAEFTATITRYMVPQLADTIDDTLAFIANSQAGRRAQTDIVLVITHDREFLGCCGLHLTQGARTLELGIWLKQAAHGHGYGREAITTLAAWAIVNLDFDYAIYPVDRANIPSRKIPEALSGYVMAEKQVAAMTGHLLDEVVYKIPVDTLRSKFNRQV